MDYNLQTMRKLLYLILALFICFLSDGMILKKQIPEKLVVLTFDDATASQYSVVAPMLKEFRFGATFFVCEFPAKPEEKSAYMTWTQIRDLDQMGFEVANHTKNHPAVSKLTAEKFIWELHYIENKCDSMGIGKPLSFAYPGYDLSAQVMETLKGKGYQFARAGGSRAYDPLMDYPLLIPSWAMNATKKSEIMGALQEAKDGKIVVLTIHGVPDLIHPWVNTPPELFKEYLNYLSDHHFTVVAMRDLKQYINVKEALGTITPDLNKKFKN